MYCISLVKRSVELSYFSSHNYPLLIENRAMLGKLSPYEIFLGPAAAAKPLTANKIPCMVSADPCALTQRQNSYENVGSISVIPPLKAASPRPVVPPAPQAAAKPLVGHPAISSSCSISSQLHNVSPIDNLSSCKSFCAPRRPLLPPLHPALRHLHCLSSPRNQSRRHDLYHFSSHGDIHTCILRMFQSLSTSSSFLIILL